MMKMEAGVRLCLNDGGVVGKYQGFEEKMRAESRS